MLNITFQETEPAKNSNVVQSTAGTEDYCFNYAQD